MMSKLSNGIEKLRNRDMQALNVCWAQSMAMGKESHRIIRKP